MRNFIIISVDCLRFDFFKEAYEASALKKHPHSLFFESAFTTSPWTYPATNSLLTGLYPHRHGAYQKNHYKRSVKEPWPSPLDLGVPTIFTELKALDYYTIGISSIFWALNEKCVFRGCDKIIRSEEQDVFYKNVKAEWVFEQFTDTCVNEIDNRPFMAYMHLCDLHRPFDLDLALEYSNGPIELLDGIDEWDLRPHLHDPERVKLFKRNKVKLYKALLAYVLDRIHVLMESLKKNNLTDNTSIIITADHGEEFWEREDFQKQYYDCGYRSEEEGLLGTGHGHTLFNEIVHIPLLFINPSFHLDAEQLSLPASLTDIFPTILEMAGSRPSSPLDGQSLFNPARNREILIEGTLYGYERKAIVSNGRKHIFSPYENSYVSYDTFSPPDDIRPAIDCADASIKAKMDALFDQCPMRGEG